MSPLPLAANFMRAAGSGEASQAPGTTRRRWFFCCRWSCVCVRGCAWDQGSFWLGTGGKATQQALQQIPGLLLVTRERCEELDDDENGNIIADFNELTRGLIATSQ